MCCAASAAADPAFLGSSSSCLCPTVPSPAKLGVVYYHSIRYVSGTTTSNNNGLVNRGLHLFVYYEFMTQTSRQKNQRHVKKEGHLKAGPQTVVGRMRNLTVPGKRLWGEIESFFKNSNFVSALPRRVSAATVHLGPWKTWKRLATERFRELGTGVVLLIIHNKIKMHISLGRKWRKIREESCTASGCITSRLAGDPFLFYFGKKESRCSIIGGRKLVVVIQERKNNEVAGGGEAMVGGRTDMNDGAAAQPNRYDWQTATTNIWSRALITNPVIFEAWHQDQ